jgi:hypothetical protein
LQVVFGMRQQYGPGNISAVNATAARVRGPLTIQLLVLNGSTFGSSNATNATNSTTGEKLLHSIGRSTADCCTAWGAAYSPKKRCMQLVTSNKLLQPAAPDVMIACCCLCCFMMSLVACYADPAGACCAACLPQWHMPSLRM